MATATYEARAGILDRSRGREWNFQGTARARSLSRAGRGTLVPSLTILIYMFAYLIGKEVGHTVV